MALDAIAFIDALDLAEIDVLGYSIGGMVAQELALLRPRLVRRLVLAATGPRGGGQLMHGWIADVEAVANVANPSGEDILWLFFERTETSMQKGVEYLKRFLARKDGRDKLNGLEVVTPSTTQLLSGESRSIKTGPSGRYNSANTRCQWRQRHDDSPD